ncbi:uncharacterized protein B0P05DRAFT_542642 [Gilbertella persicaria]|uniref:uncharacterized protein n=1 Tax=Gilbertella persicaria TaxID=101096 RepID=UPI002220B97A|nr:uncharacterized protein B0P05DRAFT_542642 [Gilbertella persicaria]KAI8078136.1 hypothetical protein B0P05DRAFT_542642 [Gilbertella persicaria]
MSTDHQQKEEINSSQISIKSNQLYMEDSYIQYDLQVANVIAEADYQDYWEQDKEQTNDDVQDDSDSLLNLVMGVQNYLAEQKTIRTEEYNSPLYDLQYKMYIYMRQKAFELGSRP